MILSALEPTAKANQPKEWVCNFIGRKSWNKTNWLENNPIWTGRCKTQKNQPAACKIKTQLQTLIWRGFFSYQILWVENNKFCMTTAELPLPLPLNIQLPYKQSFIFPNARNKAFTEYIIQKRLLYSMYLCHSPNAVLNLSTNTWH